MLRSKAPARRRAQLETLLAATRVLPFGRDEARAAARIRAALDPSGEASAPWTP